MKKTFLVNAAICCSLFASAQITSTAQKQTNTQVQLSKTNTTDVQAAADAKASANAQAALDSKAMGKATDATSKTRTTADAKKEEIRERGQQAADKATIIRDQEIGADVNATTGARAEVAESAVDINGSAAARTSPVTVTNTKVQVVSASNAIVTKVGTVTDATVQKSTNMSNTAKAKLDSKVHSTATAAAGSGTKVATAVKTKPVRVKTNTRAQSATVIKLR